MNTNCRQAPPVSVVVLTWNGLQDTKRCLKSVLKLTPPSEAEIIVVDNGSSDGTVEYLRSIQGITTLFNGENLGFVRGNNTALRLIDEGRDVVLLNNDTEIDDPDWIDKLRRTAYSDPAVGIVGCRIRRIEGGMLQHAGTYIPDFTYWGQQLGGGEKDINQYNNDIDVEGVVFACVYIKRAVMDAVGFLDEDFFSYYEDSDYCFKAREAGFRVVNCGSLTIGHLEHGSTTANAVSHNEMFLTSQKTFLKKWKAKLDQRLQYKVHLHSTFSNPVGYAMTARQLAVGLEDQGVAVSYDYLYGSGTVYPIEEARDHSSGVYRIEVIKQRPEPDSTVPRLVYGQGDAFDAVTAEYKIGYTMLETTGVPQEWIRQCNNLDELWVPSPFNEWTFRRSGATVPIKVVPLGLIDTNYFNPGICGSKIEGVYTFLSVFEWGERKSPEILLRAFNRAFKSTDPVILICRYSNRDPGCVPSDIIEALRLDPDGGRIAYSENEPVPYYQMAQLYRSADCFVLPTRGEGWGMPILEAMACGLPVIASYWSAQQLFLDDANSYPLQVSLVEAEAKCPYYDGFKWALPDEDHLVHLFRHVFDNQEEARDRGRQAANEVAAKWSISRSTARMKDHIVAVASQLPTGGVASPMVVKPNVKPDARPRVAIDISRAVGPEVTGVGRFTAGLVTGLSQTASDLDFLLMPGFGDFVHPAFSPSAPCLYGSDPSGRLTMYRGPLPAFHDDEHEVPGLDLVYCTANTFRTGTARHGAMVVYDTTFLSHPEFHTEENISLCARNFEAAVGSDCVFIAISDNTRNDFIKYYGTDGSRIETIHCGIDLDHFRPASLIGLQSVRQKYNLPDQFFLYVGSLEPRKNLSTLLRAMARYKGDERLVIVGASGWKNSEMHQMLAGMTDRVQLLGYVQQHDLPALYGAAKAFVYPSIYEGFGLPVIEAMACGTPVVTTGNSSIREIASEAALLLDEPLDEIAMMETLTRMSQDDKLRDGLVASGITRAQQFGLRQFAEKHISVFNRIIGDNYVKN